jgi:signal transduction histidine kinase
MKKLLTIFCLCLSAGQAQSEGENIPVPEQRTEPVSTCQVMPLEIQQQSMAEQAREFFSALFETRNWPPRWQCGDWSAFHGWLYIVSDIVIWFSYFMIPFTMGYFVYRRKMEEVPFRSVIYLFIAFILACGLTHLVDAAIFWWPAYRLSALIRFLTATVSIGTVFALIRIAPKVIEFKSPEVLERTVEQRTHELQQLNIQLQNEIRQREQAERKLQVLNKQLEQKTTGLEEANQILIIRERDLINSEEKIKHLNTKLEKLVEERTRDLQASNNQLEAFTYSVSHDLRAPLRAIDGYAKILEEDYNERIDSHGRHLIGVITRNARYMGQLIDDLLEFSRTSRVEVKKSVFHADEEVRRIASDLMENEKNRDIEINIGKLEVCKGDITMLRQVWTNLLSNALKYTRREPHAIIEIGSSKNGDEVQYFIKDNGVGFEMEYVGKLFGVFQRLHKKEEFEGTGVGLALVHRVLERHGGRVWGEAKLGEGATFHIALPDAP